MQIANVAVLALAVFCFTAHAEDLPEAPPVDTSADNSAMTAKIGESGERCHTQRTEYQACCASKDRSACPYTVKEKHLKSIHDKVKDGGPAPVGATGAAMQMGQLADQMQDLGTLWTYACADMGSSCYESCLTIEQSLQAQFPAAADTDFKAIRDDRNSCSPRGTPVTVKSFVATELVRKRPGQNGEEPQSSASVPGPAYPPVVFSPNPVVVENNNKVWREQMAAPAPKTPDPPSSTASDSSGRKGDKSNDNMMGQAESAMSTLAKSSNGGMRETSVRAQNEISPESVPGMSATAQALAAASAAAAGMARVQTSRGAVGMREGSARPALHTAAQSQPMAVTRAPVPVQASPGNGYAGMQINAGGKVNGGTKNAGFINPVTLNSAPNGNLYKSQDAGVGGGGGRTPSQQNGSQAQLADYLPNGRLGPAASAIAGSAATANPQILSQGKDVWQNMSMRLQYFCKIGRLYDCK